MCGSREGRTYLGSKSHEAGQDRIQKKKGKYLALIKKGSITSSEPGR
jgi:hypothetical protein